MVGKITDFLLKKWRQGFHFCDHDNDGVITREDFGRMAEYISQKTGASEEEAAITRHEFVKWHGLIQPDPSKLLDSQAFINGGKELIKDLNNLFELNRSMASNFFDRMDLNKSGRINSKEFRIFYEAVGYDDPALVEGIFKHLDKDGGGFVQREEVVDDYVRFFTNPDPTDGKAYIIPTVKKIKFISLSIFLNSRSVSIFLNGCLMVALAILDIRSSLTHL